jgi:fructose-1,6-bisphosphatase I
VYGEKMDSVLTTIIEIATQIDKKIFKNYNDESASEVYDFCNTLVYDEAIKNKNIKSIVSKDKKELISLNEDGKYIMSYVSIDNVDVLNLGFSVGTIFTIYEDSLDNKHLKYSCYVTHGPTLQLVFASDENGVQFFAHDGDKFVEQDHFHLLNKGKINSTGGDVPSFSKEHKELMQSFFDEGYRLRFSNSLSLDTHQILFKRGGLYSSPSTEKDPNGVLELIFEAYAISFILEHCEGESIDGVRRVLDISTNGDLSKKTPIYFGSSYEIGKVKQTNE